MYEDEKQEARRAAKTRKVGRKQRAGFKQRPAEEQAGTLALRSAQHHAKDRKHINQK